MSDPSGALQPVLIAALRADATLAPMFPAGAVKVYDFPPVNAVEPYLVLGADVVEPLAAEGYDGARITCTVDIWSLTDPPGFAQCKAMANAVRACLAALTEAPGFRIDHDAALGSTRYLAEQDGRTARAIVQSQFTASPK